MRLLFNGKLIFIERGEMKTTKADFNAFKKAFLEYVELFGLKDYRICFNHESLGGDTYASLTYDVGDRWVVARLNTNVGSFWEGPKEDAKHEALHLLLASISVFAKERFITEDQIRIEVESIVVRLEKVIK